ncbi:unnamed protein product [Candidula unifasciata]|uniref:Uncharacterized protein n=1 Tax=Candidula unifasciata TaxID=100452 RepID=A0A8S3ZXG2_9EUPU|nr:unnamed protein product [Candidula unifasciata]
MTSQKRYRQHQENNKNSSRFRDLPPRFKRQKSTGSPTAPPSASPTVTPVAAETQLGVEINHTSVVNDTVSPQPVVLSQMAPSIVNVSSPEESLRNQARPGTDRFQVPVSSVSSWQWPANSESYVLSQWDQRQFNRATNVQPPPVALGTHFGYKMDSPPLSPWASRNASNFPGQFGVGSPAWVSPTGDLCTGQGVRSPPMYFNNENWAPNQNLMYPHSPGGVWGKPPTPQHLYTSPSVALQDRAPVSSLYMENHNIGDRSSERSIDYSDPDIRTIEMLRELERVADEKESEDFGVDRKSLVSHHLRMLMCAVDKYTEGVEDGASRQDEVSLATNSRESSPHVSPHPPEARIRVNMQEAEPESRMSFWSSGNEKSSWKHPQTEQASLAASQQMARTQAYQHTPVNEQPNNIEGQNIAWDLWSSPSFDFSGLLNQDLDDLTRNPFSRSKESDEKRKPLYQR